MKHSRTKNIVYTAVCIAIGLLLPQVFHVFPVSNSGSVLLPMHIPVLICGILVNYRYGALCGLLLPILSFVLTGMPPLFPIGLSMMLELASYGLLSGILFQATKGKIYPSLIGAMLCGRIVMGISNAILFNFINIPYGMEAFIGGAFVDALPGIVVQLFIIPVVIYTFRKSRLLEVNNNNYTW